LLTVAQTGHAYWFFGNLYEAVVKIPDLLASEHPDQRRSVFSPGSPARYYAPAAPVTFAATLGALAAGWHMPGRRRWIAAAAAATISGGALGVYLVRVINLRLFFSGQQLTATERETLLRAWYRLNALRLIAVGGAWLAAQKARSRAE
jgi:hypothetical protein